MQQVITTNEWVYLQNKSDEFSEKRNQKVWPAVQHFFYNNIEKHSRQAVEIAD